MSTLYSLTGDFLQLLEMAGDPEIDEECLKDTMEAIGGEIEDKAENYAKIIRSLEVDAAGIDAEIKRLTEHKKTLNNNVDRMKKSLQASMEATGKKKFKTALFSFGIQKNPASLVIDDPSQVPEQYLIAQEPKINNAAIKSALKEGAEFDFARLEQTESLRIR